MQHSARPSFSFLKKKRKKLGACFHRLVFITTCLRKGDKSRLRGNNGEDGILKFPISSRKRSPDLSIFLFLFCFSFRSFGEWGAKRPQCFRPALLVYGRGYGGVHLLFLSLIYLPQPSMKSCIHFGHLGEVRTSQPLDWDARALTPFATCFPCRANCVHCILLLLLSFPSYFHFFSFSLICCYWYQVHESYR